MNEAFLFLITTVFNLYLFVLLIRLLLAFSHANYFHPLVQFINQLTQPVINPLRQRIANYRYIEISTILVIFLIECVKYFLLWMLTQVNFSLFLIVIFSILHPIKLLLNILFYAIIFQVILSWVQVIQQQVLPLYQVICAITDPILQPARRLIPPIAGFDVSPIPVLILLQFFILLLPILPG